MKKWKDLHPDPRLAAALDVADRERGNRKDLIATGSPSDKNGWSNTFADACAVMVADAMRSSVKGRLTVLPDPAGTAEPPTITYHDRGHAKTKKIDVLVGDLVAGLQIAVSLKGVGFRDQSSLNFVHNITGRLYELENETRRLHEYRPQAVVVGMYFVPIGAVSDKKTDRNPSGYADIVTNLRAVTGRSDPHRQDEWHRLDAAFVALYVSGDPERFTVRGKGPDAGTSFAYDDEFPRGVVRYFDVRVDPPRRGRPQLSDDALTLEGVVDQLLDQHSGSARPRIDWAAPEADQ